MAEIAVGIDLGTSNTCVSLMRNGKAEVLDNAFGERTSASVVHFHDDGSVEVGNSAKAKVIHSPAQTVSSAKRLIGRYYFSEEVKKAQAIYAYEIVEAPNHGVRIEIRDEEFSLPEISAMVLREMKQIAETHTGEAVTKAVITVPAYFNDNQRQATKDAGRIAGLEVLRILNEPTAAALAYGFGMGLNQRVAVYDLGGGTFDISVLEIGKDIFEVLATCGDTFLGGDDFDDRLIDLLADEFVAKEGINPRNDPFAFEKLKLAAENAKKQLSVDDEVLVSIEDVLRGPDDQPRSLERTVTRAELGTLVHDLILRTFKVCDEALQQADLTVRDLDGIILVGGPTRLPIVRDAVASYFQQEPRSDVDPDEVVAMGAAIHAASLVGEAQDSMLLDVTPLDLRIGVAGGLAEPVIERNTPVPIEQTRTFTTFQDHQESVQIRVYQGDHRMAEDNTLLGQFEFAGFEKGFRSDVKIDVTFEIDADGIVNVTATDQATGQAASTQITLSSGLDEDEMEKILEEDRAGRVATATSVNELIVAAEPEAPDPNEEADLSEVSETLGASEDLLMPPPADALDLAAPPEPSILGEPLETDDESDLFDAHTHDLAPSEEESVVVMSSQDRAIDLEQIAVEDLDSLPDEELIELTQDLESLGEDITLTVEVDDDALEDTAGDPLQRASSDDDFFDLSGADLSDGEESIDLETAIEDEEI